MVQRITTKLRFDIALGHILRVTKRLQDVQETIVSGKVINRPSDNPADTARILSFRRVIENAEQFQRNITHAHSFLNITDATLGKIHELISQARTVALGQVGPPADSDTRQAAATQLEHIISSIINLANTEVSGRYIFSGKKIDTPALTPEGIYQGDDGDIEVAIGQGLTSRVNIVGSRFLVPDLNPSLFQAPGYTRSTDTVEDRFIVRGGVNDTLSVVETGGGTDTVTLSAGTYNGQGLAQELETKLNAGGDTGLLTGLYSVSYDAASDRFIITEYSTGGPSAVSLNVPASSAAGTLGFSTTPTPSRAITSDKAVAFNIISGVNDQFTITVDGTAGASPITISPGAYTAEALAGEIASAINSDANLSGVLVDYGISFKDRFTIVSPSSGSSSSIDVVEGGAGDFLATVNLTGDSPVASSSTSLSDLNGGAGVSSGVIRITDRVGGTADIDLSAALTLTQVLEAINASGLNVSASIAEGGRGILLSDTSSSPTGNLKVEDVGSGKMAQSLGILGDVPGSIIGHDLNPALSADTPVWALKGGNGVKLGKIRVRVGDTVDEEVDLGLGSRQKVSDLVSTITGAGLGVTASINSTRGVLEVSSDNPAYVPVITDVGSGNAAQELGIQGAGDIIGTLNSLRDALLKGDTKAIDSLQEHLSANASLVLEKRVETGEFTRQFERMKENLGEVVISFKGLLAEAEDTDLIEAVTNFTMAQNALQAALVSSAQIVRTSLLDFLR